MATKPTREQQLARDLLADALRAIAQAAQLDGRGRLDADDLRELARLIAQVSSAYSLDQIVALALEARGQTLGLSSGTGDLLSLNADTVDPLQSLRCANDEFVDLVKRLEQELGGL